MAQALSSSPGLIRIGALAGIAAGLLRVVAAVLPPDSSGTGLAVLYLFTDVGIALGLIAWYLAQHPFSAPGEAPGSFWASLAS